ncbi:MAG: hypothetical protein LBM67_09005 [Lentimicrobiaceae bacterium]|jgi:hypothetical protein|nr:hypothetical protein [Lentimicrobiaceae bacterium]
MKQSNLFSYFFLSVLAVGSLIIYSCQKQNSEIEKHENHTERSLKDSQIEKRIIAFRDKIDLIRENPTLKSGSDPVDVDSAVWYIEATSNLTYGDASFETEDFIVDSAFIEIPVTNGQILWIDVQAAYDQVIDSLAEHNANIIANQKQLIVADISLKEFDNNSAIFEVTSGFGTDGTSGFGNSFPWYWGFDLGRCDGSGLGVGLDAADIIASLANSTIAVPSRGSYYTDVERRYVYPHNYTDENGNPLLFTDGQEYTLYHQCLSATDIAGYKSNLIYIGSQEKPSGKSLIGYSLSDMTAYALCGDDQHDCWYMIHLAEISYAILHIGSLPPADF